MDYNLNKINLFKCFFYFLISPFIILKILVNRLSYYHDSIKLKNYNYTHYKSNQNWNLNANNKNLKNQFIAILFLYLLISYMSYQYQFYNVFYITMIFFIIQYLLISNSFVNNKLITQYEIKRANFIILKEKELYFTNKYEELNKYLNITKLTKDITLLKHVTNLLILYVENVDIKEEILGFKELIINQFTEIKTYYDKQKLLLNSYLNEYSIKSKQIKVNLNLVDENVANQANHLRDLYKIYLQYQAIFNNYLKENLIHVFQFNEPLTREFFEFLVSRSLLFDLIIKLPSEKLFCLIQTNLLILTISQLKLIIKSRKELLYLKDINGNNLLHLAVQFNLYELSSFLISQKINVNCENKGGYTPLIYARKNGHVSLINLLMLNNAHASQNPSHNLDSYNLYQQNNYNQQNDLESSKIHLSNKINELNYYIEIKKVEKEIKKINSFIDWLDFYKSNSQLIDEVFEFKNLIWNQFKETKKYYLNQKSYLDAFVMCLDEIPSIDYIVINKIKNDHKLINQSNQCRELCDNLMQYIAIFNSFIKDNLSLIINLKQPLSLEFIDYLEESRIIDSLIKNLTDEDIIELITNNLVKLNVNLLTSILISRSEIIDKKNHAGNTILDLAIIYNIKPVIKFLQGYDDHDLVVKTITI